MAKNKIVYSGEVLLDLSTDTVSSSDHIMSGYVGHLRDGTQVTGTGQGGGASQKIYSGESVPSSSLGNNGDIYIRTQSGGSLEVYPADFEATGMDSTSNASRCIGVSAEEGSSTRNMDSSDRSTTGVVEYSFDLSSIPSGATITSVSCVVKGHEKNESRSTFTLQLYSGDTAKGSKTVVSGTSNALYTLNCGSWTRAELDNLVLHTEYGYYGGLVAGATLTIEYEMSEAAYEVTLTGSSSSWSIKGSGIYQKTNGSWSAVSSVTLESTIGKG